MCARAAVAVAYPIASCSSASAVNALDSARSRRQFQRERRPTNTLRSFSSSTTVERRQRVRANASSVSFDWVPADASAMRLAEPNASQPLKVAVLLSGGVDSSVALSLLRAAGHECVAFYLQIWFQEDFRNTWDQCPWEEDLKVAEAVCERVGVRLETVPLTDEYWNLVVKDSVEEIRRGRTPNPDVLCNSRVKFGAFREWLAKTHPGEFDRVASGHYAAVERDEATGEARLVMSGDAFKDQTYFLADLSQEQLKSVCFPVGGMPKAEIRALANSAELPNAGRKDSQGICFLGKVKFSEFIAEHLGEMPGDIVEVESGKVLGKHRAYWFHTIGQRSGLFLSGGPWYVAGKDCVNNVVYVTRDYYSLDKARDNFTVAGFNWVSGVEPDMENIDGLRVKVRHGEKMYDCSFKFREVNGDRAADIKINEDDQGLAPGQYAVFYDGANCLGCGKILEPTVGAIGLVPQTQTEDAA